MALDRQTLVNKLRASGAFTESEIESEADAIMKDDRAAERRDTLNSTKVATEPVAESSPSIAAASPAPVAKAPFILSVPTAPAGTTPADIASGAVSPTGMGLTPEQRVGNVGVNVAKAGGDLVQNALDYFSTFPNYHPNITGAAAAVPIAYAAHKAAQATGLYDTLVSKMANSNATAQPQPFVGGSGPRVTPSAPVVTPSASPIQNWDIHSDPSFGNFLGDATTPAATPTAAPSRNLTLEEAQARMAGITPAPAPVAPNAAYQEAIDALAANEAKIAATEAKINQLTDAKKQAEELIRANNERITPTTPTRPVVPTPPAASATPVTFTAAPVSPAGYNKRVTEAMAGVPSEVQAKLAKEGKVALKGYGAGDINVTNTFGPPAYAKLVDYFNEGKPIGSYENYLEINKKIQKGVPASVASEFASALPASEKEAGNFGKAFGEVAAYTKDGKIVKAPNAIKNAVAGGGAIVLLTSIPNLANAATNAKQGKYAKAGGQAAEVGMGFMPPALQALTYAKGAGEGEDTEFARQRRMAEYAQRAGRGVAQGYDPRLLIGVAPPAR